MKANREGVFFRDVPYRVLLEIDRLEKWEGGTYQLSRKLKITYSHMVHIMKEFKKDGIVNIYRKGRLNQYEITEKGKQLGHNIRKILAIMA